MPASEFIARSRADHEFFFRHAYKIRPKAGGRLEPFILRPAQQRLAALVLDLAARGIPPRIIILKARQLGFSTLAGGLLLWRCLLWNLQQAVVVAHKAEASDYLFSILKRAYDNLPPAIRPEKKFSTKKLLHFEDNDSRIEVVAANQARSFTAQIAHISELAFTPDAAELITALMQAIPETTESLVIVESTPNGIGNEFHSMCQRAKMPGSDWVLFFVPWFEESEYSREPWFTEREFGLNQGPNWERARFLRQTYSLSLEQIAWWLHALENKCLGDLNRMEQEYASNDRDCFLASGRPVFEREAMQHYAAQAGLDLHADETADDYERRRRAAPELHDIRRNPEDERRPIVEPRPSGSLWIKRRPEKRHRFVLGVDISAGDPGSDVSPIVVLNQHRMAVDCVWDGRHSPSNLADTAADVGYFYNTGKIAGEANNHGILFNHRLVERRYPNIYFRRVNEESVSGKITDKPGFLTTGANREHLFDLLRRAVDGRHLTVEYEPMVLEWARLQYVRSAGGTDRVDHPHDGSSDRSIALAIALAVHCNGFDRALTPISDEEARIAMSHARAWRMARSVGQGGEAPDFSGMTLAEIDDLEEMIERRAKRDRRHGQGGYV